MVRKIIEERLISIPEVKEILDSVLERLKAKGGEQKADPFLDSTYEYASVFAHCTADQAKKIIKMLTTDYGMDMTYAIQIVNIDPTTIQELRIILEKDAKLKSIPEKELSIILQKIKDLQA
jgi:DNA-directed RNA polymerase subunit F